MVSTALIEVGVAATASTVVATSVDASPLLTALISLGVTIVTVVGSELVKFLVAFLKNKTKKYTDDKESIEEKKEEKKQ